MSFWHKLQPIIMQKSSLRLLAWSLIVAVSIFTLAPIAWRPVTGAPASLERLAAFAAIGGIFYFAYPRQWLPVLLFLIALTGLLEAMQNLIPSRHGHILDFAVKATALLASSLLARRLDLSIRSVLRRASGIFTSSRISS
ncbi:VanZ family protein [Microvirga sp. 17 mud 1-3]|uniref:VanZ family protein n=1 Tax=Microvirga sp. 17 mud 1-3 TaxID=2082949 RepID=UPI000D6A9975|nr:VanZ family protein [Microvirga sp. 17 mud 1-3]AWM85694.1 VanZ family protein [Microvirga sp. 17 mud 1-3]